MTTEPATSMRASASAGEAVAWPRRRDLAAALFFVALVLALNYPLLLNLNSHVVGRPFDDAFEVLWQLSAVRRAVFETHSNPFYTPHVYYPLGWYTASGAQPAWFLLLLAPLTAAVGPVVTYNLTLLGTFVAGGFGVYLLARRLTGRAVAGLVAGCAYIAAPVFTLRLGGHLHVLLGMMFLPYAVGATLRAMTVPSRKWRWIVVAGALLAATILSHWYFLFIASIPLAGLALAAHSPLGWRARLGRLAALGAVALLLVAPFLALTLHARRVMLPGGGEFRLSDADQQGFSPDYLLSPNPLHPLWRERAAGLFPVGGEWDVVALGYAAVALAVAGLLATPWQQTRPFVVMGLISFVLGLGPALRWRGQRVLLSSPRLAGALAPLLRDVTGLLPGQLPVLLPDFALYYLVPFYASVRVWSRYAVPLTLVVAVLAGFGAAWLLGRGRAGKVVVAGLGVLVVLEGVIVPYRDFTPVAANQRPVDGWLAARPAGTAIIEYPRPWVDKTAMYSQASHGLSVVNGFMSFEPTFLAEAGDELGEWPNAAALPLLREWSVDYVVVSGLPDVAAFRDDIWPGIVAVEGLCLAQSFPGAFDFMGFTETHVFAVQAPGQACPAEE